MDEGQMGHVEEIVDNELVVALHMQMAGARLEAGLREPGIVWNERGVGAGGIAHEDPDPFAFLHHRKTADLRAGYDASLLGNEDAGAATIKAHAVIEALDGSIGLHGAHGERHVPMGTAILQRDHRAIGRAVEQNRAAQDQDAPGLVRDIAPQARDIPVIEEKHAHTPPWARSALSSLQ